MTWVFIVHVCHEGDSGLDMLPVGVYSNEFIARRVAQDYSPLHDDEWITVGAFPVLDVAKREIHSGHEGYNVWTRNPDAVGGAA